ncbi:MAG: NDP-sugar synthase [Candidatus Margulisiibacteriota bacterium]|nr:NDP-sugar synthase [Candidatus Margulisiibacteriota bacterium]
MRDKKLKALIMAAGYGTRLEPLTIAVPKPTVPIVNIPTMQHNIELLKKYGFKEIVANIHYHPEQIQNYFGDGRKFGVKLMYSYEKELLGTAGGVKRMAEYIGVKNSFLVLSSDALTDINLKKIVDLHKKKRSLFTVALAKVNDVSQFGVVIQDETGKITGFQEKPKPEDAKSNMVNAGIYVVEPKVLEMIPDGFYDFGKQLFPRLVEEEAAIYGYKMVEYWSDVGCLDKYIEANYDAMRGQVRVLIPGKKTGKSTWIGERGWVNRSARFEGSVIIGNRCHIGKDAYIRDSVIGDQCIIEEGAAVLGSVIWSDTIVKKDAQVTRSVIGSWCEIGEGAKVHEGTVSSNRCLLRKGSEIPPQSRLEPNSIV